jgi:hypothetical protein
MGLIDSLKKAFSKPYKTISVAQAKDLLGSGATLIDVRSAQEWRTGPGTAGQACPPGQAAGQHRRHPKNPARDRRLRLRRPLCLSSPAPRGQRLRRLLGARRHGSLAPGRRTRPLAASPHSYTKPQTTSKENHNG